MMLRLLKLLVAVSKTMSSADSVVAPVTTNAPLSDSRPTAVRVSVPLTVEAPRSSVLASRSVTFLPLTMLTAPTKSLVDVSRVMS